MLDSRFLLQRISHKHTLHLCKAMLTVCTPDLKVPDFHGQWGFSEILIHVVFNFLESFMKWFADCSHCNQERTLSNQENLPCLHDMASLATNSSCRPNVLLRALTFVEFRCSLHLSATADQLDQFPQDPVLPFQTFREVSLNCNTCSALLVFQSILDLPLSLG